MMLAPVLKVIAALAKRVPFISVLAPMVALVPRNQKTLLGLPLTITTFALAPVIIVVPATNTH
jgi:hypothetical protein